MCFENEVNFYLTSYSINKLVKELRELMYICHENLFYAQKQQNQAHHKSEKSYSYALDEKIWRNGKYIKRNQNQTL